MFKALKEKFFKPEKGNAANALKVDFHSHLLPGIDDGSKSMDETLSLIQTIMARGVKQILTTPHIYHEYYPNTPSIIRAKLAEVKTALQQAQLDVQLEAAAEYYFDDQFIEMVENEQELLTFGEKLILVETNYISDHPRRAEIFFNLKLSGHQVVFAHPERYLYLQPIKGKYFAIENIYNSGTYFQVNMLSFTGHYGPEVKKLAEWMLKEKMIHLLGSDIHRMEHAVVINQFKESKVFEQLMELPLKTQKIFA